jgi:hypothetical protein
MNGYRCIYLETISYVYHDLMLYYIYISFVLNSLQG